MRLLPAILFPALLSAATAVPIFNGRDLLGWLHEGECPTFAAVESELRTSGRGNFPNWLHTASEYENFRLHFEYKLAQWAEAAVVLRAPRWGRPAQAGIAIVLAHRLRTFDNTVVQDLDIAGHPELRYSLEDLGSN